jgi:hypothetical protein
MGGVKCVAAANPRQGVAVSWIENMAVDVLERRGAEERAREDKSHRCWKTELVGLEGEEE